MSTDLNDIFCWVCSRKNTSLKCANCVRSYHKKCVEKNSDKSIGIWVCDECHRQDDYGDIDFLVRFIPLMKHFISHEKEAEIFIDIEFTGNVVNGINWKEIVEKDHNTFMEFRMDIEWFAHNLRTKNVASINRNSLTKAAKWILSQFDQELGNLKRCSECYENAFNVPENSFTLPCEIPHILLWTYCEGWGFWPCKMMKCDIDDKVYVRYFGDHTDGCVPPSNCFIYSDQPPKEDQLHTVYEDMYELALKEVKTYIENIKNSFGNFYVASKGTRLDPNKLEEHLEFMIGKKITPQAIDDTTFGDDSHEEQIETEPVNDQSQETEENFSNKQPSDDSETLGVRNNMNANDVANHTPKVLVQSTAQVIGSLEQTTRTSGNPEPRKRSALTDVSFHSKKMKEHLEGAWKCWDTIRITNSKLEGEKHVAIDEVAKLKAELKVAKQKVETMGNEITELKKELATEKSKKKNECIVCGKECLMFCGPGCVSEHYNGQKPNDK